MKQAIPGVSPASVGESTVMVVWPSVAKFGWGSALGRLYGIRWPDTYIFRLGHLFALMFIPVSLLLYFLRLAPSVFGAPVHGTNYRLTNRRVIERRNELQFVWKKIAGHEILPWLKLEFNVETKSIQLDRFDSIEVQRQPGQPWYDAGDLVFKQGQTETFRLEAVSRPEAFRHVCEKTHKAYVGVQKATQRAAAAV